MDMANHIRRELEGANYTAIIFQILDNNIFFARHEDGGLTPAKKHNDGIYHIEANLVVADKAAHQAILKMSKPLWGGRKVHVTAGGRRFSWTFLLDDVALPIIGADFLKHFQLLVDLL